MVLTDRRDDDDGVDVSSSSTMIRPGDVPGDEGRVDAESAHRCVCIGNISSISSEASSR